MQEIISLLRRFISSKRGSSLVGLLAVFTLIWFAAPRLGLTNKAIRLEIIIAILLIYLIIIGIRTYIVKKRGDNLSQQLQAQQENLAGRQLEIEALKEKMHEAITSLKASELGVSYRGNAALYALPWYMIIGPSASGKSTLLRNSGLHFPFSSHEDLRVKGFGGTRNCDWWFADEAILLDTAGRYTTEEDDHEEWVSFLSLLKKNRPKLPINGIIIAISLVDLLTADGQGIEWHVKVIRERIEELYNQLGYVFPVYIMFTKVDLLQGFSEFFGDLSETERQQVWGATLIDLNQTHDKVGYFTHKLEALFTKLTQIRIHKLSVERNLQRKLVIYDFPEQFKASIDRLKHFVTLLLKDNPYQETPKICGTYFTSGTQEGTPISRVIGNMSQAFGYLEGQDNSENQQTKSYFIKDLFAEVIFKNKELAARSHKRILTMRWLKSASVVICLVAIVTTFMLYSASFTANAILVHRGANYAGQLSDALNKQATDRQLLHSFDKAFVFYQNLVANKKSIPLHLRLGLYRGDTQMQDYQKLLNISMQQIFLQPVGERLEQTLTNYHNKWIAQPNQHEKIRGNYYETLRSYLMLSFPARINVDEAYQPIAHAWTSILNKFNMGSIVDYQTDFANQVAKYYLTELKQNTQNYQLAKPWSVNADLVKIVREQLYSPTNASNLYALVVSKGENQLGFLNVHQLVTGFGSSLLTNSYNLPVIYTKKGWKEFVYQQINKVAMHASHGDWVIDTPLTKLNNTKLIAESNAPLTKQQKQKEKALKTAMQERYFTAYTQAWVQFLQSINTRHFVSLTDAAKQLTILGSRKGPIVQLLRVLHKNIGLTNPPGETSSWSDFGDSSTRYVPELNQAFSDVRPIITVTKTHKLNNLLKTYLQQLSGVQADLEQLAMTPNAASASRQYAANILSGRGSSSELFKSSIATEQVTKGINNIATRRALHAALLAPIKQAWRAILQAAVQGVQQQWQTQVMPIYRQNINGKFPFARHGKDAYLQDVAEFFRPNSGTLWKFVNTNLGPFLYSNGSQWQQRTWLGIGANFSQQFLADLTQAQIITNGLFSNNSNTPDFAFQVYPIPTPGLDEIKLESNGQVFNYRNGPQEWRSFRWPGQSDMPDTMLMAETERQAGENQLSYSGVWGLFHLLSHAQFIEDNGSVLHGRWGINVDGHRYSINLLFRTGQANIFQNILQKPFKLPDWIFPQSNNNEILG